MRRRTRFRIAKVILILVVAVLAALVVIYAGSQRRHGRSAASAESVPAPYSVAGQSLTPEAVA